MLYILVGKPTGSIVLRDESETHNRMIHTLTAMLRFQTIRFYVPMNTSVPLLARHIILL